MVTVSTEAMLIRVMSCAVCWTLKCTPLLLMTFQHCYQWQPLVSVHADILYTIIIVLV